MLLPIKYERGSLQLLDQRRLPLELVYLDIITVEDAWKSIRDMVVRGAPAIGVTAALAVAVEAPRMISEWGDVSEAKAWLVDRLKYLTTSRPTAVNLFKACADLTYIVESSPETASIASLVDSVVLAAEGMYDKDVADNIAIGQAGGEAILQTTAPNAKVKILTHCNAGALATAQYGTALGVIRYLQGVGRLESAFCTETRPYNQGARLTAFEFVHDKIPATLVCDSMVAALMGQQRVDAVVVGADRVAANGDTANKIGTFQIAIAAKYHGVPFYVAAPLTTMDLTIDSGDQIVIEQRAAEEMTHINGQRIAAPGIEVWNPSFDVTPAALIDGLITEVGVIRKAEGSNTFDVRAFVANAQV